MVAVIAITVLSSMPPLTKYIDVAGLALAAHRFVWLSIALVAVLYLRGGRLSLRAFELGWPSGVLFAANIALFYTAVKLTTVANATVLGAIQPVLSLLLVGPLFGEKVRRSEVAITAFAVAGVVTVVYGSSITPVWSPRGDVLALLSTLLWTAYLVTTKRARLELGALELQTVLTLVAGALVLPLAVFSSQSFEVSRADWPWLAFLVIVPGAGHTLVNWAHAHTPLVLISMLFLLNPVVATGLAALFLDEPVNGFQIAGMVLVVGSLAMLMLRLQRPKPAPA
ncbi:MAG: DMT family transporter [Actinomycetota bacterium]|nr:DMT family transporter [Actinomycetota bacterium]